MHDTTTQHVSQAYRLAELQAQLERVELLELLALQLSERADELEAWCAPVAHQATPKPGGFQRS